jgi:hypothetical protein
LQKGAQFSVGDLDPDQLGSRSFFERYVSVLVIILTLKPFGLLKKLQKEKYTKTNHICNYLHKAYKIL